MEHVDNSEAYSGPLQTSTIKRENLQKPVEDLFKTFYFSLGTTTYLLKIHRFASFVPFNVIEMV